MFKRRTSRDETDALKTVGNGFLNYEKIIFFETPCRVRFLAPMNATVDLILPASLAFIMFALGVGLKISDFVRVVAQPKAVLVGLLCQIVLLPVVALVIVLSWPLEPEIAIGIIVVSAAPGGPTSNLFTRLARGDVALSVTLTAVSSLLCVLTVPPLVFLASEMILSEATEGNLELGPLAIRLFLMVTLPVLAGMAVRMVSNTFALRAQRILLVVSALTFALVLALAIYQTWELLPDYMQVSGLVTAVFLLAMMAISFAVATAACLNRKQQITITIESGLQNATLAIATAAVLFGTGREMIPAITYGLIAYVPIFAIVVFSRNRPTGSN